MEEEHFGGEESVFWVMLNLGASVALRQVAMCV